MGFIPVETSPALTSVFLPQVILDDTRKVKTVLSPSLMPHHAVSELVLPMRLARGST